MMFCFLTNCLLAIDKPAYFMFFFYYRHPLSVDRSVNFLAHLSLEEYGPCLQVKGENSDSQKHLEEVTDGFSVSAIKVNTQHCKYCKWMFFSSTSNNCPRFWFELQGTLENYKVYGSTQKTVRSVFLCNPLFHECILFHLR